MSSREHNVKFMDVEVYLPSLCIIATKFNIKHQSYRSNEIISTSIRYCKQYNIMLLENMYKLQHRLFCCFRTNHDIILKLLKNK